MNKNNSILLAVIVVALVATWLFSSEQPQTEFDTSAVFPDLLEQVGTIDKISIAAAGGTSMSFQKNGSDWQSADYDGYPASLEQVTDLLNALTGAQLDEAKTSKPENFARLGLQDISSPDSQASLLTLASADREWQLLVGNSASSGAGIYIRKPGENQTWLTAAAVGLPESKQAWLKQTILDIEKSEVTKLVRVGEEGWEVIGSEGEAGTVWQLGDMPEGRELRYGSILDNLVEDFMTMSFNDMVAKADAEEASEKARFEVGTKSGQNITATLLEIGENTFIEFASDTGDAYWLGWRYQLSTFTSNQLDKTLQDLLAEQTAPVAETETDAVDGD